jgi:hypothetical protein
MSKPQPGCGPKGPDSATRAENPEEELSTDERRISLRVKVRAEDGTAVVEMTGPAVPENGLQVFGDWVLAALEQHADGAAEAARLMIAALRERDWDGDDVLADQLDALLGSSASLRPLPVDLDELAGIIEGDPMYGGGRVDLATGEVWPAPDVPPELDMRDRLAPAPVQSAGRSGLGTQTSPATAVTVPREAGVADDADQGTSTSGAKVSSGKPATASRARAGSTAGGSAEPIAS